MKLALQIRFLLALAPLALQAQSVAHVDVASPQTRLIVGEQVQLTAVARDANGRVLRAARFSWGSDNEDIVQVDSRGRVTAVGLGVTAIDADMDGVNAFVIFAVLPLRLAVTPHKAELAVGETLQFRAVAYDIKEAPIPNVAFEWRLTGAHGFETNVAWITPGGLLTATALGPVTVRAVIRYDHFVNQFEGLASVEIKLKKEFQLTRLLSTGDVRHSFQLRPSYVWNGLAANDQGQLAFVGSLDGLATGLLLYENGRFDLLAGAGEPMPVAGSVVSRFGSTAMNNRGQVLSVFQGDWGGGGLLLANREQSLPVMLEGESVFSMLDLHDFVITPHSLNDSGRILFRARFRVRDSDEGAVALFRLWEGFPEVVWSFDRQLQGLEGPADTRAFGIDGMGTSYFLAHDGSRSGLYRARRFSRLEKIIATGDEFAGGTVDNLGQGELAVAEDGDVAFAVYLQSGDQYLVWVSAGEMETVPGSGLGRIFSVSNAAGVLFEENGERGQGLYVWNHDTVTPVLLPGRLAPNEEPVRQIDGAAMSSQGRVFAQVRTTNNDLVVLEPGGPTPVLFQAGDRVNVTSNLSLHSRSLVSGSGSGPPTVLLGSPGSLFELGSQGPIPKLVLGDRLPDGAGFGGAWDVAEDSLGNLYLLSESGLLRLSAGRVETVLPRGLADDDGVELYLNRFEVNDSGAVVFSAGTGEVHEALYLWRNERLKFLAALTQRPQWETRSPAGGTFLSLREFSIDALGRVMAFFYVLDGPAGYFLYDNGQWQPSALMEQSRIGGVTVAQVFGLQAIGDSFYSGFSSGQCCNSEIIAEYRDAWSPLITSVNALPRGELPEVGVGGMFDVNRRGDMVFDLFSRQSQALVLRTAEGTRIVHITGEETDDGDLLWDYRGVDLRDDGRLYFTALDVNDRVSVYEAKALSAPPIPPSQPRTRPRIPTRSRTQAR